MTADRWSEEAADLEAIQRVRAAAGTDWSDMPDEFVRKLSAYHFARLSIAFRELGRAIPEGVVARLARAVTLLKEQP